MKKNLLIFTVVIILLLGAAAAAPFWFSMESEKAYQDIMQRIAQQSGMATKDISYDRGWLESQASATFVLPGMPISLSSKHRIIHGPLPLARLLTGEFDITPVATKVESTFAFGANKDLDSEIAKALSNLPPVKLFTTIDLTGNGQIRIEALAAKRKLDNNSLDWRGITGEITFDSGWKKVKLSISAPGLTYDSHRGSVAIKNISLNSDLYEGVAGYMFGTSTGAVGAISFQPFFTLKGLRISSALKPQGENVTATISYDVRQVVVGKDRYGPGALTAVIRNLDAATLRKFEEEMNQITQRSLPQEQASLMLLGKVTELAAELSRNAPELEITKLSFKAPLGELGGKAKFVLDGRNQNIAQNPMLMLTALKGSAEVTIPVSFAKIIVRSQIQQEIQNLKSEGKLTPVEIAKLTPEAVDRAVEQAAHLYLSDEKFTSVFRREGDNFTTKLTIDQGRIQINGKPFPILGQVMPPR